MTSKWLTRFELKPGRWVYVPTADSVSIGKQLKAAIEKRWTPPPYFYHLRAGGHVAALQAHVNSKAFLRLDIHDFFGSIGRSRVGRALTGLFSRAVANDWAHASTVRHPSEKARTFIPFGFVQSPILASICLAESALGTELRKLSRSRKVRVSVYVDDIILSSKDLSALSDSLLEALTLVAARSRFTFSAEKTQGPSPAIKAFNIEFAMGCCEFRTTAWQIFLRH